MALNLTKIRERLDKPKGGNFEKTDYTKIYWKPSLGEQVVRVVPSKFNPEDTNKPVRYHKWEVFKRTILSLKNFNEKDPVESLVLDLYEENRTPGISDRDKLENDKLIQKLRPTSKYAIQVIVRGEEAKGVRIWEANASVRDAIDKLTQDEDYGDITDINNGTDLTVTGFTDSFKIGKMTKEFVNVGITPKRKASPLSNDADLVEKWLAEQNDPLAVHKKYSFDELKDMLMNYIDPENSTSTTKAESDESDDDVQPDEPKVQEPVSKRFSKATSNVKGKTLSEVPFKEGPEEESIYTKFSQEEKADSKPEVDKKETSAKKKFAAMFDDEDE
jgi:hypothetical protein